GFFAASLSLNCTDCHTAESGGSWARYADDTPLKNTARRMVVMVNAINKADFGGERKVTCYTCHRGSQRPEVTPSLAERYGKAPGLRTTVVHTLAGDNTTVYDGREGWVAAVDKPVPLMPLTGGDLEGARADADLAFPAQIKQEFSNWHGGFPAITINDKPMQVIEGTTAGGSPIKLY